MPEQKKSLQLSQSAISWLFLSLAIIVLDQLSKYWVLQRLEAYEALPVFHFFTLTHWHNHGAAFGLLDQWGVVSSWLFGAIALVIVVFLVIWMLRTPKEKVWQGCALSLLLGGAIGNVIDRALQGYVIDYLYFHYQQVGWPAFNLADIAISAGATLLIIDLFRKAR